MNNIIFEESHYLGFEVKYPVIYFVAHPLSTGSAYVQIFTKRSEAEAHHTKHKYTVLESLTLDNKAEAKKYMKKRAKIWINHIRSLKLPDQKALDDMYCQDYKSIISEVLTKM